MALATTRLHKERILFKKSNKFGFYAKFNKTSDGGQDIFNWSCGIKTSDKGPWKGAVLKLRMEFKEDYPGTAPKCVFEKIGQEGLFHPNIYPSGTVCLSILNEEKDYRPTLTVNAILLGIADLLDNPNPLSPAHHDAFEAYQESKDGWMERAAKQANLVLEGKAYEDLGKK